MTAGTSSDRIMADIDRRLGWVEIETGKNFADALRLLKQADRVFFAVPHGAADRDWSFVAVPMAAAEIFLAAQNGAGKYGPSPATGLHSRLSFSLNEHWLYIGSIHDQSAREPS